MRVHVGCEFRYDSPAPIPTVWQVRPRADLAQRLSDETWNADPSLPRSSYHDSYGNVCDRVTLPAGPSLVRYDAHVEVSGVVDETDEDARQIPVEFLPDDTMVFLLPSRFCLSDLLRDRAWELFGGTEPGWARVVAVCDWVHENVKFQPGASNARTSALDVWDSRTGVCRDFAHLGVTLCRAVNIPARLVVGYSQFDEPPPDFHAVFEAWLGGEWVMFDATRMAPVDGIVRIAMGRDAKDVAFATIFGPAVMTSMNPLIWPAR